MDILIIALLIFLGLLFCVVELLILPGVSIGGVLSVVCTGSAIYLAFRDLSVLGSIIVVTIVIVLTCIVVAYALRSKTWSRLSLKSEIKSSSSSLPEDKLSIGQKGVTISRLSPVGKIEIDGHIYEAKSVDSYVDPKAEVEVIGFENFSVIVRKLN